MPTAMLCVMVAVVPQCARCCAAQMSHIRHVCQDTLMKLLELLSTLLRCAAGPLISDDNGWEMVQVR